MNDLNQLTDEPPTIYVNANSASDVWLAEDDALFKLILSRLRQGSATDFQTSGFLQTVEQAAVSLAALIAEHASQNCLTPGMVALLAEHLGSLTEQQTLSLFGLNKANRKKTKEGQITSAAYAFTDAMRRELGEKQALILAYDAYFAAGPKPKGASLRRTYAADLEITNSRTARRKNRALGTMESTILPALAKLGLVRPMR